MEFDLSGRKFGKLSVLTLDGGAGWKSHWLCQCDCGNKKVAIAERLLRGKIRSCGCLAKEILSQRQTKHGMSLTPIYKTWMSMKERCQKEYAPNYANYGGRGIKVCERWETFENFYQDMGEPIKGMSLDRIDNDGDYSPQNCKWSTAKEQTNNRRNNHPISFNGATHNLKEWATILGISHTQLSYRIANWSVEKAFTTPSRVYCKRKIGQK